jgi:hypothetical protein
MSTLKVDAIRHNSATSDAITTASDGTCTARITGTTGGGGLSHRNLIINGQFDVWQRATDSGSNTTDGYLSADRWYHASSGATKQVTRVAFAPGQTDVPDNPKYYLRYAVTTGNNNVALRQRIEDVTRCQGEMTFSFWVKGSNPGGGQFALIFRQNFGTGGNSVSNVVDSSIANYTVSNTWTKKTFTFTPASISGKTLGSEEGSSYYEIELFRQPAGDTSTDAFTVDFANVQLERGSISTSFEQRKYGEELRNCERYFQCLKGPSLSLSGSSESCIGIGLAYTSSRVLFPFIFKTEMRNHPTVSVNTQSNLQGLGVVGGWNSSTSFVSTTNFNTLGGRVDLNFSGTPYTAGHAVEIRLVSDGLLSFDAEL